VQDHLLGSSTPFSDCCYEPIPTFGQPKFVFVQKFLGSLSCLNPSTKGLMFVEGKKRVLGNLPVPIVEERRSSLDWKTARRFNVRFLRGSGLLDL
jgi:hypothetical protein